MEKMSSYSWARLVSSQEGINEGVVLYFPEPWALCFWSRPRCWPPQWKLKVPLWTESSAQLDSLLFPGFGLNSQLLFHRMEVLMLGEHRVLMPFSSTQTRSFIIPDKLSLFSSVGRAHVLCSCLKHLCPAVSNTPPWAPSWGAWGGSWGLEKFWREGAGGFKPRAWKIVCSRMEERGKENVLVIQKHLRLSGFPFDEACVSSWTAEMLLAVQIAE